MKRFAMTVAAAVISATTAFAQTNDDTLDDLPAEELADILNQFPQEQAIEYYMHLTEYTQCTNNGGAIDAGKTTMNVMDHFARQSMNILKNRVERPLENPPSIPLNLKGLVVCESQYTAMGLLHGGKLASATCDETGKRILTFSRPLGKDIGLDAGTAAPTCNAL